ncbi:relaxase/mobilization nuclease domain-containing protein [Mesorhizobium erdmanii]|uniref:relaxase/mobilization nuclease domain-containing protein n=1 Tax=Mesorhizobium erdmanii TaxID=1777866 RepID=UPI00041B3642|nr:relaxase/mobilization nuclease domain-containing protein [Mesorhizobium erdmanii]
MNLDQSSIQAIEDRIRASAAFEDENRKRRNRAMLSLAANDDDWLLTVRGRKEAGGFGGSQSPEPAVPRSSPRELEPPRGKAGRLNLPLPTNRRKLAGGLAPRAAADKLAAGYQPAVLKVISYGHGVARAAAIGQYIQKEGVALETHDARILATQGAVAEEMKQWGKGFDKRRESEDVATFRLSLAGEESAERLSLAVQAGFAGHGFAYRIDTLQDGSSVARVVSTMAGHSVVESENGDKKVKHRFHLSDRRQHDRQFSAPTRAMIASRICEALGVNEEAVSVKPLGEPSHGKAGVVFQLSRLTHDGAAIGADGATIASEEAVRQTAQFWDKTLNSYKPRDIMHMILSAKAGEDRQALVRAARGFLHEQFPNHKFAFGMHADMAEEGGHIHVHAVVAVKGEDGERLRPGPAQLREWRALYAQHAQAQGMKIVSTSAAYRASSQSYGPRDKAIVATAEKPRPGREARDRAYARANPHVIEKARQRIDYARANPIKIPISARQLRATQASLRDWRSVAAAQPDNTMASQFIDRMTQAVRSGTVVVAIRDGKGVRMSSDATADQMRENLKEINETVNKTAAMMNGQTKAEFLRRAAPTMELLAIRTDLKSLQEGGVTHVSEDQAHRIAGARAEALIHRAQEIEAAERLEADRAREIRNRAIEQEIRDERAGSADPTSLEQVAQDREMVRNAESIAAKEAREAQAASEAARALAQNPNERLDPEIVKGERLEELQRLQSRSINTAPVEGEEPDSQKPQKQ